MNDNSQSGVRESNAGDEFHILWAARQAVKLLNPQSGLKTVLVEKVAPADVDASEDDLFLGVDLSEYYGGADFESASGIVLSQLKYSTRHPKKEWTASRLCRKKSAIAAPVIKRMAEAFDGFLQKHERDAVVAKLKIRLVSNQPISTALISAINAAKQILSATDASWETATHILLKQLSEADGNEIEKLYQASKLKSSSFTDFMRALDFSKLGEESNAFQRIRLIQELSVSISYDPEATLRNLCELIRYEARPETENSVGLAERDVLATMGVGSRDALFPAPSRLQPPPDAIKTEEPEKLAHALLNSKSGRILAHGNAGVGKTTTVLNLSEHLPSGSIVIIYDCYGGGDYLIAGDERHTQKRAFLQLTNELAVNCGTPLLIKPSPDVADTIRDFRRSLEAAAAAVAADGATLIVVIDAADNAVVAAQGTTDCFVYPLWNFPLPASCRLLVTSRTHRRETLNPSPSIEEYELVGFDDKASAVHLRRYFPSANDEECRKFHTETAGNPRLQYYNLEQTKPAGSTVSIGDFLLNAYRTPDQIFADLVEAAVAHSSQPEKARQRLALLTTLKPPVPLEIYAVACGIETKEAENFCRALMPGLVLEDDEFVFRDEDFETYVRHQVSERETQAAHARLGEKFLSIAYENEYAARAVAEHLFFAGKYTELIDLVIDRPEPLAVADEVLRLRVKRERIEYALKAAQLLARTEDVIKLLVIAAETARSDEAVATLIRENPDLAAVYAAPEAIMKFYLAEDNEPWLGTAHLRTATLYARNAELKEAALEHLRAAEAWFRRRRALPKHEIHYWETSALDIACGAEAIFWTRGAETAQDWLARWRPVPVVLQSLQILIASLVKQNCRDALEEFLRRQKLSVVGRAVILSAMREGGAKISVDVAEKLFTDLARFIRAKNYRKHLGDWTINVCELFASLEFDQQITTELIDALCPRLPESTPDGYGGLSRYDAPLRALCLKAALDKQDLDFEKIIPEKFRPKEDQHSPHNDYNSERRKWREYVGKLLPVYKLRARTIIEKCKIEDVSDDLRKSLKAQNTRSDDWSGSLNSRFTTWLSIACDALLNCAGDAKPLITEIADEAEKIAGKYAAWRWLEIAEKLVGRNVLPVLTIKILERGVKGILENAFPSRERWEFLVKCASLARPIDEVLSRSYYRKAIKVAEGINDENVHLLKMLGDFGTYTARSADRKVKTNFSRRLASAVESHESYVSETSILPWQQTVEAACRLDAASGLALCVRWDAENRFQIDDAIIAATRVLTEKGDVSVSAGLQLLRLAGKWFDPSGEAIFLLDALKTKPEMKRQQIEGVLETIGLWIRRDAPLRIRKRAAAKIVKWAQANSFADSAGVMKLSELLKFLKTFLSEEEQSGETATYRLRGSEEATRESVVARAENGLTDDFERHIAEILGEEGGYKFLQDYLTAIEDTLLPAQRVAYLEKLIALDLPDYYMDDLLQVWKRCLNEWREFDAVKNWAKNGVVRFFEKNLLKLMAYEYSAAKNLKDSLEISLVAALSRVAVLLPAVMQNFDAFVPRTLYMVAALLNQDLDENKRTEVFDWTLARLEDFLTKERMENLSKLASDELPENADRALAHFFWVLFGHPDKRVRWQAVHAAREIVKLQNKDLFDELCNLSFAETGGAFHTSQTPFYWMSARVWFLILAERLAAEVPELIKDYASVFSAHVFNPKFPHAQIREIAKRAALKLAQYDSAVYPAAQLEDLRLSNAPRSCIYPIKEMDYEYTHRHYESEIKRRFRIGSMDTLPYWYAPAAHLFNQRTEMLAEKALTWIENAWNFTDDDCLRDPLRGDDRYDWRLKGNDHGSNPTVEDLRLYLEYNAMFCAAGEMIDSLPILCSKDDQDDPNCPWAEWLADNLPGSPNFWLENLRGSTPLAPEFWGERKTIEEWFAPDESEFDRAVCLPDGESANEIIIKGYSDVWDSEKWGQIFVNSALVASGTARSLLFALQTTDNSWNYKLPAYPSDKEIKSGEFQLTAWLDEMRLTAGLDKQDSSARESSGTLYLLGDDFFEKMSVTHSINLTQYFTADESRVARLEIWNDMLETERITEPTSQGQRLRIKREVLLEYLNHCERDLILEVTLKRHLKDSPWREREEKRKSYARSKIYLFRRNGTIETLDGNGDSGQENS